MEGAYSLNDPIDLIIQFPSVSNTHNSYTKSTIEQSSFNEICPTGQPKTQTNASYHTAV